jgi:hypothetical protein
MRSIWGENNYFLSLSKHAALRVTEGIWKHVRGVVISEIGPVM